MIQLHQVSKIYKVGGQDFYALRDVNLTIEKGEFVSVCGTSGSGKSTLLNIIGCLDFLSSGQYLLKGENISQMKDEKQSAIRNRYIGFVLQDFALIHNQTVLYNVMLPLLFSKMSFRKVKAHAMDALACLGIRDQARKKINQLSGGQKQRVAIARAIVTQPDILLADEPTGQLDSHTGMETIRILSELNKKGITLVVVTHDPTIAAMAERTITITDGRIVSDLRNE